MTLTKEWLLKTIAELEEERDAVPGAVNEDAAMALAAMKRALASLMAEPDYYVVVTSVGVWQSFCKTKAEAEFIVSKPFNQGYSILELYTAPPAPVSVPEPIKRNDADGWWMYKGRRVGGGCAEWYNLALDDCRAAMLQGADEKPELTVWYGSMPESNGKANWTAILHRKGEGRCMDGFTIDRSEYPGRVLYAADRVRYLIGEKSERPSILDYDADAHSGYVKTGNSPVIPGCSCRNCRPVTMTDMRFVVCPECGNKRCAHANDHRNACTGSNEPGQEGSAYPAAPQQEVK
ncbi:hypothetical protein N8Z01_00735 [Enterobacter hormaechei subsp. hoffmannii]|nr:hypothetical protein [Enterobacter hormaechei subsp. hoffmannii]